MKKLCFLLATVISMLSLSMPIFAAEDTVMIEMESNWDYTVVDDDGFATMDPDWMTLDYDADWSYGTAPFGDRIIPDRAEAYGWVGENDGIFLRQTFKLRSATVMKDMNFYIRTYYDNTVHIYLNGVEIFANDNGGSSDWVDDYVLYKLEGVAEHLRLGKNVLAVSVHDNAGGREFDLSFFATNEEIDDSTQPPVPDDPEDTPTDSPVDNPDDSPADFGNTIPFTKVTAQTAPPIVTVYLTSEAPAALANSSYIAPLTMMGASFLVAIGMIVSALLLSRRMNRSSGGGSQ